MNDHMQEQDISQGKDIVSKMADKITMLKLKSKTVGFPY